MDVCKAGTIGTIQAPRVSADVQRLEDVEGRSIRPSGQPPEEVSVEGPEFGGGHGVFSYFVLKGLGARRTPITDGAVDITN